MLSDDDPLWEQSSGGDGHRGIEWGDGDDALAEAFYPALPGSARLILDLLIDRPGERVDAGLDQRPASLGVGGEISGIGPAIGRGKSDCDEQAASRVWSAPALLLVGRHRRRTEPVRHETRRRATVPRGGAARFG